MILRPAVSILCVGVFALMGFTRIVEIAVCLGTCSPELIPAGDKFRESLLMLGVGALVFERAWYAIYPPPK